MLTWPQRGFTVAAILVIALLWGWVMKTFFPANPAPYLDCCVTVLILTAQLLSGNVFMPIVCGLYLVNGLWSLYSWMKLYKKNG